MADTKISALTALTGANVDTATDVLVIVDTSVTTTKKILIDELRIALGIATQAQQETGTSLVTTVTPGSQQYHPSAAKAWVKHDAAGNMNASYNVASVTDSGPGSFAPVWATDFSSADYCPVFSLHKSVSSAATTLVVQVADSGQAAGSLTYTVVDTTTVTARDPVSVYCVAFGDQA